MNIPQLLINLEDAYLNRDSSEFIRLSHELKSIKKYESSAGIYTKDKGFINAMGNRYFTNEQMKEISKEYKGANRLHKPLALLFWTDCNNGHQNNWKLL